MREIDSSSSLELKLLVSGAHLSGDFGSTISEIRADGFKINKKVYLLPGEHSPTETIKSMSDAMLKFAKAFKDLKVSLIIILGDRYESFAAACTAMILNIPIAHIHGGEVTSGAFDDRIRHSITKMAILHFVAANEYKRRVIQLGENPNRVFQVGGLGIENIRRLKLIKKASLEKILNIKFREKSLLVTFHPVTLEYRTQEKQLGELLSALSGYKNFTIIFTLSNNDPGGAIFNKKIKNFVKNNPNSVLFDSLGSLLYLSCMAIVDVVVGNSSSGILEAPALKKAVVNIGSRQDGRLMASNIICCKPNKTKIESSINKALSKKFREKLASTVNPFGNGNASKKIVRILENVDLQLNKKFFFDSINLKKIYQGI
jgi:GDP/UDP-N,N'-diacetylbacillosamine 2-epimerase (hydrolysing)